MNCPGCLKENEEGYCNKCRKILFAGKKVVTVLPFNSPQKETSDIFRLVLFNYVFSNGDAHLKNFSAIQTSQGDYVLSPGYDLLCTRIHSPSEPDMALTLFRDGFSETYEAYGFYTYQDFLLFGQKLGIKVSRVEKIIREFATFHALVKDLTTRSFLSEEFKKMYLEFYQDKIKRLKMRMPKSTFP